MNAIPDGIWVEEGRWPVVVCRVGVNIDREAARAFNAKFAGWVSRKQPFFVVTDLTHMSIMPLAVLQELGDRVALIRPEMERFCRRGALITPHPVVRAIGRAALVFLKLPMEVDVLSSEEEMEVWAAEMKKAV